jgi:transcriptional regulator with XRE-family HTH domain
MDLAALGSKIRQAREANNLTQEEVVERLGRKDITAISEYENGKRRLAAFELPDLARALNVPITYFFEDVMPEDELETALVEWFRMLPDDHSKRRIFTYIKATAPLVLGGDKDTEPKKRK